MTFDRLYAQYLLEMNRRDFLKNIGKGAAAVTGSKVMPSSLVKISATPNIQNAIYAYWHLVYNAIDDNVKYVQALHKSLGSILSVATAKNPNSPLVHVITSTLNWINEELDGADREDFDNFIEMLPDDPSFDQMMTALYDENYFTPQLKKRIQDEFNIDIDEDYNPSSEYNRRPFTQQEIKDQDAELERLQRDREKAYIDNSHSRFDKAGGSEDDGYAKYYEKHFK